MPSSATFTGVALALQSVTPRSAFATLRVRFTNDPVASSPVGIHDALNIANYTLSGPSANAITGTAVVPDDTQSVDLLLAAPLTTGAWILGAANIQTPDGDPLEAPTSLTFDVTITATLEGVNPGAENDSAESIIRKHLSPAIRGRFIDGLIAAFAIGDRLNWDNAKLAFDQLFKSSASGVYLDRKCADDGLVRPEAVGMGDDLFRRYAIKTTSKKLTPQVLLEILEVFYGSDATRAFVTSEASEPFVLADGMELDLLADEKDIVKVVFSSSEFGQISQAKAVEVAAAITRRFRALNLKGFAVAYTDPETNEKKIRLYSSALGLAGSMRVQGGEAQGALRFPDGLLTTTISGAPALGVQSGENWTVTVPEVGIARFTLTGASTTDLMKVRVGDYVNAYGSTVHTDNRGSFPIRAVDVRYVAGILTQYFEVAIESPSAGSFVTAATDDLLFFRPSKKSINGTRAVIVSQPEPGVLHVVLPATTLAVERTAKTGAYAQLRGAISPTGAVRQGDGTLTVNFPAPHGLSAGEWVFLDGMYGDPTPPANVAGNGTTVSDANPVTIWSDIASTTAPVYNAASCLLADGRAIVHGGRSRNAGADLGVQSNLNIFAPGATTIAANGGKQYAYAWSVGAANEARENHRMSLLVDDNQNGNVLATGGNDTGGTAIPRAYIYSPGSDTWSASIAMTARTLHEQVVLDDGRVLVIGGSSGAAALASADLFTSSASGGSFTATGAMDTARLRFRAVKLDDGRVLVIGGETDLAGTPTHLCEIYDPMTSTWTRTGDMAFARSRFCVVALPNNKVLVVGGVGRPVSRPDLVPGTLANAEIFDVATGRWSPAGKMTVARKDLNAHYLPASGKVLVFGSGAGADYFDVDAGAWRRAPIGKTGAARENGASVLLDNGTVLFATGLDTGADSSLATALLFQPGSDSISAGALNGLHKVVSVPSGTSLTLNLPNTREYTTNLSAETVLTPATAVANEDLPGPFIFDPDAGVAISETETTSTQGVNAGQQYKTLRVADATGFPDAGGYLVLDFGTAQQTGPVLYLGRQSTNELILDYSYRFPKTIPSGFTVTLLTGKAPFVPERPETVGSFYLTASSAGRVAASNAIDDAVAAGIEIEKRVQYPGDRGLGGEGLPSNGAQRLSDKVAVWGGDNLDSEIATARES